MKWSHYCLIGIFYALQSCSSVDDQLRGREGQQPYILAVGRTKNRTEIYYIVVDKQLVPCQGTSSLATFDELFNSHFVFNLSSEEALAQIYTFGQITVYNIDVGTTTETPEFVNCRQNKR